MAKKTVESGSRIKLGIPGLDRLLKSGVLCNNTILVAGSPGTGKSIFAMQFLLEGARQNQKGMYIAAEESKESILAYADSVGLGIREFIGSGIITVIEQPKTSQKLPAVCLPVENLGKQKIRRVVLDSLTLFEYMGDGERSAYRKELVDFLECVKCSGATLIATSELSESGIDRIIYRDEDFLFDGLILLAKIRKSSSFERCITIAKLRGQDHPLDIYPFSIGRGGIKVNIDTLPFSLIESDFRQN